MTDDLDLSKITLDDFLDCAVLSHGWTPYMRDYYFHIETHWTENYGGQYLLTFKHCYEYSFKTKVKTETIKLSWDDLFSDYKNWENAGQPEGFVWGVNWSNLYPGFSLLDKSGKAKQSTSMLDKEMKELEAETEAFKINLIF